MNTWVKIGIGILVADLFRAPGAKVGLPVVGPVPTLMYNGTGMLSGLFGSLGGSQG